MFPEEEQPLYVLPQKKIRALLPKIISLIILGSIFYFGILLNISLLELSGADETIAKTASLIIISIIMVVGIYLSYRHAKQSYKFYHDRITQGKKKINYIEISEITPKHDLIDKIFKTSIIQLNHKFFIRHIPIELETQIQQYINQLIGYAKKTSQN